METRESCIINPISIETEQNCVYTDICLLLTHILKSQKRLSELEKTYLYFNFFIMKLGAQCIHLCTLKGTVGWEAEVGTGKGLSPSSTLSPSPSCCSTGPMSVRSPALALLLLPADSVERLGLAPASVSGASSSAGVLLPLLPLRSRGRCRVVKNMNSGGRLLGSKSWLSHLINN